MPEIATTEEIFKGTNAFRTALGMTLSFEGGVDLNEVGKSGISNQGITQNTFNSFRRQNKLPIKDVRTITPEERDEFYRKEFFERPKLDVLPDKTAILTFDFGVNASPKTAVQALQKAVGSSPDGKIGPKTRKSVNDFIRVNGEQALLQKIIDEREKHNEQLIKKNPAKYKKFEKGWKNRIQQIKDTFDLSLLNPFAAKSAEAAQGDVISTEELFQGPTTFSEPDILTTDQLFSQEQETFTTDELLKPRTQNKFEKFIANVTAEIISSDLNNDIEKSVFGGLANFGVGIGAMLDWFGQTIGAIPNMSDNIEIAQNRKFVEEDPNLSREDKAVLLDQLDQLEDKVNFDQRNFKPIMDKLAQWGKTASDFWRKASDEVKATRTPDLYQGSFMQNPSVSRSAALIAEAVPSLGAATAVAFVTKNPFAGAAAIGFPLEAAPMFQEARAAGVDIGKANVIFAASGIGTSILEALPITRFLRGGSGQLGKDIFLGAVQEGAEEAAQAVWNNMIARIGYDNTRRLTEGIVEGIIAGAGSGGILGGVTSGRGIEVDALKQAFIERGGTEEEFNIVAEVLTNQIIDKKDDIEKAVSGPLTESKTDEEGKAVPDTGKPEIVPPTGQEPQKTPISETKEVLPEERIPKKPIKVRPIIRHFTLKENVNKILKEGFDTSKPPIHGTGGLESGPRQGKIGKDVLYFTTDDDRWKQAVIFVGEGKGNISRQAYDYDKQKFITEKNAYKKVDLEPIEAEVKDESKILVIDSLAKAKRFLQSNNRSFDKFRFLKDLIDVAQSKNWDILNLKNPGTKAWEDTTPNKFGQLNRFNELTGRSGKDDYFILNKNVIEVKKPVPRVENIPEFKNTTEALQFGEKFLQNPQVIARLEQEAETLKGRAKQLLDDGNEQEYLKLVSGQKQFVTEALKAAKGDIVTTEQLKKKLDIVKKPKTVDQQGKGSKSNFSIKPNSVKDDESIEFDDPAQNVNAQKWQKTAPLEAETEKRVNKTQIIKDAERSFGITIRGKATERWNKQVAGAHYKKKDLVRLRTWGELEPLTHEIAHNIDEKLKAQLGAFWRSRGISKADRKAAIKELKDLDYDQERKQKRTSEGFAEFMRHYLTQTGEDQTKAPHFYRFFIDHFLPTQPELAKKIERLRNQLDVWYKQGAENRITQQIDFKGEHTKSILNIKDRATQLKNFIITRFVDELYTIKDIQKRIGMENIRPSKNPFKMATYMKMKSGAIARTFVLKAAIDETGNPVGGSLADALKPVNPKDIKKFVAYAVAKRALLIEGRGKESGFDVRDAEFLVDKYKNQDWDKAIDDITVWSNHLLDWIIRAGGLTEESAKIIRELNPIYLPFKRAFVDDEIKISRGTGGLVNRGDAVKRLKGSGRPIINPLENLIQQATEMIAKAQKLHLARLIADLAEQTGTSGYITEVPPPISAASFDLPKLVNALQQAGLENILDLGELEEINATHGLTDEDILAQLESKGVDMDAIVTIFGQQAFYKGKDNIVMIIKDGKRKFFEVHPQLYRSLLGVDYLDRGPLLKVLSKFSRLLRMGATQLNPAFGLARNPYRDALTYVINSRKKGATVFDPVKGLYREATSKQGDLVWRFKAVGGELSGFVGYDRASVWNSYDLLLDEQLKGFGKVLKVVKHPIDSARALLQIPELAPRIAELEATYKQLRKKHPDWSEEDVFIEAVNNGQDVTINFTRSGNWGKRINEAAAFFNAGMQSFDKIIRTTKDAPIQTIVRGIAWLTLPAMLMWWKNKDKQWYKNLPPAYKYSNQFYEIGDQIVRLPNPFEWGVIFISMPLAALDVHNEKDPVFLNGLFDNIKGQIPDPTPTMLGPYIEVAKNKNFIGVPIETEGMKFLPVQQRKKYYTSNLATSMSRGMNALGLELSPVQVEHLLNGYTGGFFRNFSPREIQDMTDMPVLGSLLLRSPENPKRQLNQFFGEWERLSQRKSGNLITQEELKKLTKMRPVYNALTRVYFKNLRVHQEAGDKNKVAETYLDIQKVLERVGFD